jgi:hypothetical protein
MPFAECFNRRNLGRLAAKKTGRTNCSLGLFLKNRAGYRRGRDTGNPRDPRSAESYLLRRTTFFAPLLLLCDLPAPVRVFVDFFTMRFFDDVFFDLEAEVRFATISTISFGCLIGRLRSQGYFTSAPQKREAAHIQIRCSSWFPDAVLQPAFTCDVRPINFWTCVTSERRTYSGIKKTGQAKSFTGKRFAIRDSAIKRTSTRNIPRCGIELAGWPWTFAPRKPKFEG